MSTQSLPLSKIRVQRLLGGPVTGYRKTHLVVFLISPLSPFLFPRRRRELSCKLVEGDLEKDTGWPLRLHLVKSLSVSVRPRPSGQREHTCGLPLRERMGLFLHCVFSRFNLTTTTTTTTKNEVFTNSLPHFYSSQLIISVQIRSKWEGPEAG